MTLFRGYGGDLPLMRWLREAIWPVEAKLEPEDVYWGARLACAEMIRTGTTRFWDMYWHPGATARAVHDAGLRATIGGPLFDADGNTAAMQETALSNLEELAELGPEIGRALTPHAIYTVSEELLRWTAELAAERGLPVHIHLSETEQEVSDCLERHGLRPAAYLDRLGLLGRAHRPRPRRLARRGRAGADRRARLHGRRQPGRQHEAGGRRRPSLSGRPAGWRRGRARHRRGRIQRLARPARRPQGLRPGAAPRRRRPDDPSRRGGLEHRHRRPSPPAHKRPTARASSSGGCPQA